ncbi:hypothetical protein ACO0LB_00695 [Undibacterium sp. SXout7W]|uniref:hypothetical protein n=1 Tax=Undibacterium sp. SXout7W TaxID=3413049 RepID=UPI003BF17C7C
MLLRHARPPHHRQRITSRNELIAIQQQPHKPPGDTSNDAATLKQAGWNEENTISTKHNMCKAGNTVMTETMKLATKQAMT